MWSRWKMRIGLILGPAAAPGLLAPADLQPGHPAVTAAAAVAVLMAVWWITEAIPIPAGALLPIALHPVLGIMKGDAVAAKYVSSVIFLFIGGFIVALAMERCGLHRRIALRIITLIGASPRCLLAGFIAATFVLSMWISNPAATMMMIPIAMAIVLKVEERAPGAPTARFAAVVWAVLTALYAPSAGELKEGKEIFAWLGSLRWLGRRRGEGQREIRVEKARDRFGFCNLLYANTEGSCEEAAANAWNPVSP